MLTLELPLKFTDHSKVEEAKPEVDPGIRTVG